MKDLEEMDCIEGYIYCSFHMYGLSRIPQNVIDYINSKKSKQILDGYNNAKKK